MSGFKIELGSKARDRVTGVTGTVIARSEWLYGCRRYVLQPTELKDGRPVDTCHFDEDALEVIEQAAPHVVKPTGGPQPEVARGQETRR